MLIRPAGPGDSTAIWSVIGPMIAAGETNAIDRNSTEAEGLAYWLSPGNDVFVAEDNGKVLGTYYLRPNQAGGGRHVCNGGYITSVEARGRGVARAMCEHSLNHARARGYRAIQFNFVVSTNERAVKLWQSLGFDIVGRLPGAFDHPAYGYVDALVMFRTL